MLQNENLLSRITIDPEICHGKPCVRGMRYPVEHLLEYLAAGDSIDELVEQFQGLEREDLLACIAFSREVLTTKSVHLAVK